MRDDLPQLLQNSTLKDEFWQLAQPLFSNWLFDVNPTWHWNWQHLQIIRRKLAAISSGKLNRLMIFLPPRHGKSEMVTVRYAAWRLERDPAQRVIIGAYNQTLANTFSRKVRKIALSRGVPVDRARSASEQWETLQDGGLRAAGVGAGITGMGGNLIIIDDPVKNRAEANSITYRNAVWQWYTDDLYTRLEPDGQLILICTRWHEDDLAGRILDSPDGPNWDVVSLPALAMANDPLGREPGAALCPERYDEQALEETRIAIGTRAFTALFQQQPAEQEGGMFSRSDFQFIDAAQLPTMAMTVRYWDKAASSKAGDYSAAVKMGRADDGNFYVLDVRRGQWSTNERDRMMVQIAKEDGPGVPIVEEQEPGSSGVDVTTYHARMMAGYVFSGERATGDKETRAAPFAAQVEAGNVYLVRAPWNNEYIDELCAFPNGAHDDQVDPSAGAFGHVAVAGWFAW